MPQLFSPSDILQRYARFGVDLGLSRIERLLHDLGNPHHRVPIIHVAGTNGKGSVCAYLSAVLTAAGYRVGRYTSPHLVRWHERICINEQPITTEELRSHLQTVEAAIDPQQPTPTQFEVFTAAAWCYFAAQAVDLAVLEVGLGGRLDATNVCATPLVSVIVSISRDHWQRLGPTLADIAREKAGILKPGCPVMVGPLPDTAAAVVARRAAALGCPINWVQPAEVIAPGQLRFTAPQTDPIEYPQALLGDHQRVNSAVAIAALQQLQQQGWEISPEAIQQGMAQVSWPGRLQWLTWQGHRLLIDGAHNVASAQALRQYVDQYLAHHLASKSPDGTPQASVTWLMGILETKDHKDIFTALLRPGDRLHLVPVPGHLSAQPIDLAQIAQTVCHELAAVHCHVSLHSGLAQASTAPSSLTVFCGSLYLIGYFFEHFVEGKTSLP